MVVSTALVPSVVDDKTTRLLLWEDMELMPELKTTMLLPLTLWVLLLTQNWMLCNPTSLEFQEKITQSLLKFQRLLSFATVKLMEVRNKGAIDILNRS